MKTTPDEARRKYTQLNCPDSCQAIAEPKITGTSVAVKNFGLKALSQMACNVMDIPLRKTRDVRVLRVALWQLNSLLSCKSRRQKLNYKTFCVIIAVFWHEIIGNLWFCQ